MNRIQNAVLVVWIVLLVVFVASNPLMVWRPITIVFLFQEFHMPILLWLVLGGIAAAGILRALAGLEVRIRHKQADKEIHAIKAKAFDGLTGEVDKLVTQLQDKLGERVQSIAGGKAEETEAAAKDTAKDTGQDSGEKPAEAGDDDDAPPKLSAETSATLAELKSGSGGEEKEEEAEKKPKRRWRKKKS